MGLALIAFAAEIYIIIQASLYGKKISITLSDDTTCNEGKTLRFYLFWLATGVTTIAGLNLAIALIAIAGRLDYWRQNVRRKTFWRYTMLPPIVCCVGLMAGILPVLLVGNNASGAAALIIFTLYFQTVVWALVLAWRDVLRGPN